MWLKILALLCVFGTSQSSVYHFETIPICKDFDGVWCVIPFHFEVGARFRQQIGVIRRQCFHGSEYAPFYKFDAELNINARPHFLFVVGFRHNCSSDGRIRETGEWSKYNTTLPERLVRTKMVINDRGYTHSDYFRNDLDNWKINFIDE